METNLEAIKLMERIGGGFASALSIAWQKADLENQRKPMSAFQDLHDSYVERLKLLKEQQS